MSVLYTALMVIASVIVVIAIIAKLLGIVTIRENQVGIVVKKIALDGENCRKTAWSP